MISQISCPSFWKHSISEILKTLHSQRHTRSLWISAIAPKKSTPSDTFSVFYALFMFFSLSAKMSRYVLDPIQILASYLGISRLVTPAGASCEPTWTSEEGYFLGVRGAPCLLIFNKTTSVYTKKLATNQKRTGLSCFRFRGSGFKVSTRKVSCGAFGSCWVGLPAVGTLQSWGFFAPNFACLWSLVKDMPMLSCRNFVAWAMVTATCPLPIPWLRKPWGKEFSGKDSMATFFNWKSTHLYPF